MAIHSKDSKTWTTKLNRIGKRAAEHPATVFNNLGHILDETLLKEVYLQIRGNKAVGIDKVTKVEYGQNLEENIRVLISKIRSGEYCPRPSRITEIPKEDGSKRPLAVACFEDKLVQAAVSTILTQIYEPMFLPCSYGFRAGRGCHDALRALYKHTYPCWNGAVVEIDIRKYFNTIPHGEMKEILKEKISDQRFLRLIDKMATAPVLEKGKVTRNERGCPQGSILSPILANIYLHHVVDTWFEKIKATHIRGKAEMVRYADDMVFIFERAEEAARFYEALPKRLRRYGLEMHEDKSRLIPSGQNNAARAHTRGSRLPTYQFLGFTIYWGKARNGKWWRMYVKSRADRMTSKLKGLNEYLKENKNTKGTRQVLEVVAWVVRGWVNYHAVSDNHRSVRGFLRATGRLIKRWANSRGRKCQVTWKQINQTLESINFPQRWNTVILYSGKSELNKA